MALYPAAPLRVVRKTRSEDQVRDLPQRPTILTANIAISTTTRASRPSHLYSSRSHSHGSIPSQDIRPLPSPPTPLSRAGSLRAVRPLPPPPPTPSSSEPSLHITPATPLPPSTPSPSTSTSSNHLAPPKHKAYGLLSLQTSLDSMHFPSLSESPEEFIPSPLTPSIPVKPSPSDARKKRMAKLRRHLGESLTDSMILGPLIEDALVLDKTILSPVSDDDDGKTTHDLQDLIFTKMPLDSISLDSSSTSDEEEDSSVGHAGEEHSGGSGHPSDDEDDEHCWIVNNSSSFRAGALRRVSKKWLKEKGGHRWEEQDYTDILRALRAL
ncbi:hypothetical protein PM082_009059 [Marasmius tenuissimus]|nr:hypothetical protein PM082_009059 [Marasmius tenuissimus]